MGRDLYTLSGFCVTLPKPFAASHAAHKPANMADVTDAIAARPAKKIARDFDGASRRIQTSIDLRRKHRSDDLAKRRAQPAPPASAGSAEEAALPNPEMSHHYIAGESA